jgi:hypothetical protein
MGHKTVVRYIQSTGTRSAGDIQMETTIRQIAEKMIGSMDSAWSEAKSRSSRPRPSAPRSKSSTAKGVSKSSSRKGWPKSGADKGEFTNVSGYRPYVEQAAVELGVGASWRSIQDKAWEIMQFTGAAKPLDSEKSPGTTRPRYLAQMSALLQYMKKRGDAEVVDDKVTFKGVTYAQPVASKRSGKKNDKNEGRELAGQAA